jgi:hypothetical protein
MNEGGKEQFGVCEWDVSRNLPPSEEQQVMYSGYKRHHGFKYQAVVCPDGLIESMQVPMKERLMITPLFETLA